MSERKISDSKNNNLYSDDDVYTYDNDDNDDNDNDDDDDGNMSYKLTQLAQRCTICTGWLFGGDELEPDPNNIWQVVHKDCLPLTPVKRKPTANYDLQSDPKKV
jgi:hypothetical protein